MAPDSTREDELAKIPLGAVDKSTWPPGVRSLVLDEHDAIGVDASGELYWHGKQIEIKRPIVLTAWQKFAAFIVAASTVSMAIFDAVRYFGGNRQNPLLRKP